MRILLNTVFVFCFIILFFCQAPAFASNNYFVSATADSCGEIVDNYLDAVDKFNSVLEAMLPLSNEKDVTSAINDAINGINNNNITYNAMQAYDGSIKEELKKHPNSALNAGMSQLNSQLGSLHTRVDQWKSKNTGCREKHACDLGEPGYCNEKH